MARTKQTARKSTGGKAPRKTKPDNFGNNPFGNNPFGNAPFGGNQFTPFGQGTPAVVNPREYEHDFDPFAVDVLGEEEDASGSDLDFNNDATADRDQPKTEGNPFLLFDFRRGPTQWPSGAHLVDSKEADQLLKTAKEAAEKTDDKDYDSDGDTYMDAETIVYEEKDEAKMDTAQEEGVAPSEAKFETLKDGSTALIIPAGTRLRLDLKNLLNGQWEKKKKKKAMKKKPKKPEVEAKGEEAMQRQVGFDWLASIRAMRGKKYGPYTPEGYGSYAGYGNYRRRYKEYLDAYTITMDVKFLDEFPRDGVSLMQTALIHSEENVKASRKKLTQSEGECVVTRQGGVGTLGTFGDVTKAKVERNKWTRIVMTVNCSSGDDEKGEFRTFVNASPCATIKSEAITSRGRFSIDPETFFLFSSKQNSMMPGSIALRAVRVENVFSDEAAVKAWRARDKVISIFEEDRKAEIDKQRQGLALSELFPKPRPIWLAPTMIGLFGDPFISGTPLEGSSLLPWSFAVLNFALQRMLQEQGDFLEGVDDEARGAISDVMHILDQSDEVFKQMMKLLKYSNESQMMSFLRRLRSLLQDVNVGESLLIPLLVERTEMILLMERTNEQAYRFVVVQTDPAALDYHVSTAQSPPKIKYRTCMVLSGVPKKNALDDVFWLAVFNLSLHSHPGDINKFYSVLLPFLTNQTLESSMVESAEMSAKGELGWEGDFKAPQRSATSYVRCVWHCINYLLRKRGLTKHQIKRVQVALRMQFVCFIKNDIKHVFPNENGRLICDMACSQLAYAAAKLIQSEPVETKEAKIAPPDESSSSSTACSSSSSSSSESKSSSASKEEETHLESVALNKVRKIVDEIRESLEASAEQSSTPIPLLDLAGKRPEGGTDDPALCQYRDGLAWEVPDGDPDPGQPIFLSKYVPIDILQMPVKASTRQEAVMAISLCDRLCTLMDNQAHTVKNDKFLIFSLIQQLFTQILPIPKPRDSQMSTAAQWKARRGERRKKRAAKKKLGASVTDTKSAPAIERDMSESEGEGKAAEEEDNSQPSWKRGLESEAESVKQKCIWDAPITYELQMEMMMTIHRLLEHFVAASLSLSHNRALDGVCIIVPGCIAAIGDAIMRRRATDRPSEVCSHLMGQSRDGRQLGLYGFGIGVAGFAQQTETIEIHSPELHIARTAVLDYFQSPQQRKLAKIFTWENSHILKPGRPLIKYLRNVCKEIALVLVQQPVNLLCDSTPMCSLLMLNYPELRAYRDICFWWKYFLNPDLNVFPNIQEHIQRRDRLAAQLVWSWEGSTGGYNVHSFNGELQLFCRPDPNSVSPVTGKVLKEAEIPTSRYPSTASPSFYVSKPEIRTEDDVVYRHNLPNFSGKHGPLLGQRDSELLISYLTVPYLRVPLVVTFFATEDRVHKLRSKRMRGILDAVLFEPGKYQSVLMCGVEPVMVPTAHPQLLATPYGLLLNELCRSPDTIIRSTVAIMRSALALDTGSVCDENASDFNTSVDIILYVCRLAARVENYISFLIEHTLGTHPCVDTLLRDMEVTPDCLDKLQKGLTEVRGHLHTDFVGLFNDYLQRLDDQCRKDPKNEVLIDRNSRLSSDLHTHKLIMLRNLSYDDLSPHYVTTFIGSFVYLTTRHTWNKSRKSGQIMIPEHELYELLAVQRVRLVKWVRARVQSQLDEIMQTSLQVATSSTGSMRASEFVDEQNRWSRIQGPRSIGRYAVGSSRTVASAAIPDAEAPPPSLVRQRSITSQVSEVPDDGLLGVEIDLQIGQMTLRSRHLSALESDTANLPDVKLIFGDSTMQASLLERAEHRQCIRLVGLNHDLEYWGRHGQSPPLDEQWERPYDPSEMFESEQWIVRLFEPVRRSFFNGPSPPPMQFMLPERALPESAEVAVLVGLHQSLGGPFKLVYVFRRLRCLHIYEVLSHGRQWWWSLHLTTDVRFTLRELQPSTQDRQQPFPDWWENGAGVPYPGGVSTSIHNDLAMHNASDRSVVIIRDFNHHDNLSGGKEIFIPERFLYGLIPNALFENFLFWQDESRGPPGSPPIPGYRRLRGYPTDADNDHMIFVELYLVGSWKDLARGLSTTIECTGLPGRVVQVMRVSKARTLKEFRTRQQIASALEVNHLLVPPPKPKRASRQAEDKDAGGELKVGSRVEVYRTDSGEHWPATITSMNENETIDVKFTGDYEWAGSGTYTPENVQPRGAAKNQNQGEGVWHWNGMTDSEDQDWASTSDDEEEKVETRKERQRITYAQMNDLGFVLAAADNNEELCLEILNELKVEQPFTAVADLVDAIEASPKFKQASLDPPADAMVLLNLLYAPRRSRLFSLAKVLSRVENLSYICAWTSAVKRNRMPFECDRDCPPIDLVELPRLKLAFTARMDPDKQMRLYSMDHADLFVSNERPPLSTQLLQGMPHALLLSNLQGELKVLVPVVEPIRPAVASEPFSTRLVLNRANKPWSENLVQRYFLYTVHISLSFLLTQGLSTALYLMLLRFLHRDYEEVFRLSDSVATDTAFTLEANMIFQCMSGANNDSHPDAHSCRAKVTLGIIDSGAILPWDLTKECSRYIVKLSHISANCRISLEEELQLLQCDRIVVDEDSAKERDLLHPAYIRMLVKNRLFNLQTVLDPGAGNKASCWLPPRSNDGNWLVYSDSTVFGEKYREMVEIDSMQKWEDTLASPGLVLTVFHVLWNEVSKKCLAAVRDLCPSYPYVTFASVRADARALSALAKVQAQTFPTFVLFRDGKEVPGGRVSGSFQVLERVVVLLQQIAVKDKAAWANAQRKDEGEEEQEEDLLWTWNSEHCGAALRVEDLGMTVKLAMGEDEEEEDVLWEKKDVFSFGHQFEALPADVSAAIEREYRKGTLFTDMAINIPPYRVEYQGNNFGNRFEISDRLVAGFQGNDNRGERVTYQRRGARRVVPNEPELSEEQKRKDKRTLGLQLRKAALRQKMVQEKIGKDTEAICGTMGFAQGTGMYKWTLLWNHEPTRNGAADGLGVCVPGKTQFGPMRDPLLGDAGDGGASVALYASGSLLHKGTTLSQVAPRRGKGAEPKPAMTSTSAPSSEAFGESTTPSFAFGDSAAVSSEAPSGFSFAKTPASTTFSVPAKASTKKKSEKAESGKSVSFATPSPSAFGGMSSSSFGSSSFASSPFGSSQSCFGAPSASFGGGFGGGGFGCTPAFGGSGGFATTASPFGASPFGTQGGFGGTTGTGFAFGGSAPTSSMGEGEKPVEEKVTPVDEQAPCWGKGQRVTCILDTDANGGSLSFQIDDDILDVQITDVFALLSSSIVYPSVCLAPPTLPFPSPAPAVAGKAEDDDEKAGEELFQRGLAVGFAAGLLERGNIEAFRGVIEDKEREVQRRLAPSVTICGPKPVKPVEVKEKADDKKEEEDEENEEGEEKPSAGEKSKHSPEDDTVSVDRVIWMWEEQEKGWQKYSPDISRQLEIARRDGKSKYSLRRDEEQLVFKLLGEISVVGDDGEEKKMRRHVVGEGLSAQWEIMSVKYAPPVSMRGIQVLQTLERVWAHPDAMDGQQCQLGFLFLYSLLQGQTRCKVFSSYYGMYGYGGGDSGGSDAARFALLLAQLYSDCQSKSVPASIIDTLNRNRQLCMRMPRFKDTRKLKQTPIFNGWKDEREPKSPLAELFSSVVPIMQGLKKKRGAIIFPPKPPHPELPPPLDTVEVVRRLSETENRNLMRPTFSDYACDSRSLSGVSSQEIMKLATLVGEPLRSPNALQAKPPLTVNSEKHFQSLMVDAATAEGGPRLVVVVFFATWCSPCTALSPLIRTLALKTPTAQFLRVDVDDCDALAKEYDVKTLPVVQFMRGGSAKEHILVKLTGYSDEFLSHFLQGFTKASNANDIKMLQKGQSWVAEFGTSRAEMEAFASRPLLKLDPFLSFKTRSQQGYPPIRNKLPFHIEGHPDANTSVARSMLTRMEDDIAAWAKTAAETPLPKITSLSDADLASCFGTEPSADTALKTAHDTIEKLIDELKKIRDDDASVVQGTIPLLVKASNWLGDRGLDRSKKEFLLRRQSGQEPLIWLQFIFGVLLSSRSDHDLRRLNPFLSLETVRLVFDLATATVLRSNRVGQANRCIAASVKLLHLLDRVIALSSAERQAKRSTLLPTLVQAGEDLAEHVACGRYFIRAVGSDLVFDPRFLIFEFTWNIILRQKQVEIVNEFLENLRGGRSKVKQMIMGNGKTTVVAPLLALMLADGKSLVMSVVPRALVEMSRKRLRETFATIMQKRVYTLKAERSTSVNPGMFRSLQNAVRNRGIVVSTPTSVKSIMLLYIEHLGHIKQAYADGARLRHTQLKTQAGELIKILNLFREGVMLLDEVDLILHPLKSELNFPLGEKHDLDASEQGERWNLPMHLLDAIFFAEHKRISTFEHKGVAVDILRRLTKVIEEGYERRALQRLPHITVLNKLFYDAEIKPVMAEWAYLFLQKHHLHGIDRDESLRYIVEGATARSAATTKLQLIDMSLTEPSPNNKKRKVGGEAKNDAERARLQEARTVASRQKDMINEICSLDADLDQKMREDANAVAAIQKQITDASARIEELEFPRDDSLDNAIVLWYSMCFDGAKADTVVGGPMGPLLGKLEDSGLKVWTCSDAEDAIDRARQLLLSGRLRCIVTGGGENAGCQLGCTREHPGQPCLSCGVAFEMHRNHGSEGACPLQNFGLKPGTFRNRASFALIQQGSVAAADDYLKVLTELTVPGSLFAKKHSPVPTSRAVMFCNGMGLREPFRMKCWNMGLQIMEAEDVLEQWIAGIEEWPVKEEVKKEVKEDDEEPPAPTLNRQVSAGTTEIQRLRIQVDRLENDKLKLQEKKAEEVKLARVVLSTKYAELCASIEECRSKLEEVANKVKKMASLEEEPAKPGQRCGPVSGRDAALALAWLDENLFNVEEKQQLNKAQIAKCLRLLADERKYLAQTALAAKVVTHVSMAQKKLLNLTHDWLQCFMPHCLSKVNRVSFGLLNAEDCAEALRNDPHMPRSRLKLAVPFVGKDVPSQSSEFAHPDVIIGLTVLAYRYSGLRPDDFMDIVDSLTATFTQEIGPARDRPSSRRHELWVSEAGGSIRGLKKEQAIVHHAEPRDDKRRKLELELADTPTATTSVTNPETEVVQLKYLQKSNQEQMDKLFALWKMEPLCIHYYLAKTIFPTNMRAQRVKISASGQAVGGNMLVGRRVGFSGTPSDLLPKELGKCDYETGDDGKMLTTVLDPDITSSETLPVSWNVDFLLEKIATAENPRYHALIDTGALVTGYMNKQVAATLLKRGLSWCDGVAFLDDQDKLQVLVRATGRVVDADQCGIPLERRFAFYDQIHTTGMDIKHVVNAKAVITLGKDMVFRDYVQGVFRMRGVGAGQTVVAWIIPEVAELFHRELRKASQETDTWYARINEHANDENRRTLVDIAAGLVLNSMKSEQVQWNMLCVQNVSNIYRKNAFARIQLAPELLDGAPVDNIAVPSPGGISSLQAQTCLDLFHETVDFSLDSAVPDPVPFSDKLRGLLEQNGAFILTPAEHDVGKSVLLEVGEHALLDEAPARLDTEQEQEQEQEQEKEVKSRKDQQIEVEKFVDREYSRMEEAPRSWHISMLGEQPMRPGTVMGSDSENHPFYSMRDFRLRHQDPLTFPTPLHLSRNYFDPNWTGLRRVKNVVMLLEWAPASHDIQLLSPAEHEGGPMTESQLVDLQKSYNLLRFHGMEAKQPGLTTEDVINAVQAATDARLSEDDLASIMAEFGDSIEKQGKRVRPECITIEGFTRLLRTGRLRPEHKGRMWVAVSLAEAETLRRVMHLRQNRPLLNGKDVEVALRYSPMSSPGAPLAGDSGVIFDSSCGWKNGTGATPYQASVAHNCMRFFDADMYYPEAAINVLVRALQANKTSERERFFLANIGCRRRLERRWQDTPLARALTLPDEWAAFKQRVHTVFVREAIQSRQLTIWEAFTVFDADNNGMLSPAEVFGAMRWLGVPDCTAEDVVDFINAWDTNQDGMIEYNEYLEIWRDSNVQLHENEEDVGTRRNLPEKIEPYGDQELREVMHRRKTDELLHKREEKVRRDLYQASFDTKLFAEELEASKNRKGGANPLVSDNSDGVRVIEYRFTSKQLPLRTVTRGTAEMVPMRGRASRKRLEDKAMKCPQGHPLSQSMGRRYPPRECDLCNRSQPRWRCEMDCDWDVCNRCHEQWREERISKQEEGDASTYISCNAGASITVQVPSSAIFAAIPTALDLLSFTVTLELMVAKLPTQRAALLRFSSPEHTRSRRQYSSNVYLTRDGVVQGPTAKPDPSITPQAVVPKKWHVVSVSVNCKAGLLLVYVDGKLSGREEYTDAQELKLQDKLTVLGGGKQAESCGGNIRRVLVHEVTLGPEKVLQLSMESHKQMIGKRYIVCCEVDLGYVVGVERPASTLQPFLQALTTKLGSEFELKYFMQTQDDEALATIIRDPGRVYCACVALTPAGPRPKKKAVLRPNNAFVFSQGWGLAQPKSEEPVEEEDEQKIASALAKSFRDCSSSLPLLIFSTAIFKEEEKEEEGTVVMKPKKEKKAKDVVMKETTETLAKETEGEETEDVDEPEDFWKAETKQACPPAQWPTTPAELSGMVSGAGSVDRTELASEEEGEKEEEEQYRPTRPQKAQPFGAFGNFGRGMTVPSSKFNFSNPSYNSNPNFGYGRGGAKAPMSKKAFR